MSTELPIILGSSSLWRKKVFAQMMGINESEVQQMIPDIDEKGKTRY